MTIGYDPDKQEESCGVFGIFAPGDDVARLAYFSLYALQHRGQESAGIAVTSPCSDITSYKDMGLVNLVFSEKILRLLKGQMAIGHVRYSTTGSSVEANAQPVLAEGKHNVAVAHNGNLVNTADLRADLEASGQQLKSTSDTEVFAELIARSEEDKIEDAIVESLRKARGAFSLAMLADGKLVAARDEHGFRPLCLGTIGDGKWVVASETCALSIIGAKFVREIDPGEIVFIDSDGPRSVRFAEPKRQSLCIFEFIYFARPDSIMMGKSLHTCRKKMGGKIAREAPVQGDLVVAVPDSGIPAAIGYAAETGIPYDHGFNKNRYVGRTFIQPDQSMRDLGVRIKLNPLIENIEGKRIIMVDDSIVRGSTSKQIIKMLYNNGAKEVHVRVSSPPIKHPCFYGIDMATRGELIASSNSVEEVRMKLGCNTLAYLSIDGLVESVGGTTDNFCMACFDGNYPIQIPQQLPLDKWLFEENRNNGVRYPENPKKK
jgi:amidophosphoribosyltransferase